MTIPTNGDCRILTTHILSQLKKHHPFIGYTQMLIDSRPIVSSLAGVYGIEQLPANMIDRVEIM